MYSQWIGCCASNFLKGRGVFTPSAIVIHSTSTSLSEIDRRCATPGTHNSVHYGVGRDGEVHQYVEEKDTAFHTGVVVNPTWQAIQTGKNPNLYTIGIEYAIQGTGVIPDAQYQASAELIGAAAKRCSIVLDLHHIVLHSEIRAGTGCPGPRFDRARLLSLIPAPAARTPDPETSREITVLHATNVREKPCQMARIVRVARANSTETVIGFEEQGERINGNALWYKAADGNFLWAGSTDTPNLIVQAPAPKPEPQFISTNPSPVACGIASVDDLLLRPDAPVVGEGSDPAAIGMIQDLLTGHGFSGLPSVVSGRYGTWDAKTAAAIESFRNACGLPVARTVDKPLLQKLVGTPARDPRVSRAYLTLVLQFSFSELHKILSLVSQMEGAGKFAAVNRNTDHAGLSFGIIQWAQKPGRLTDILLAMSTAARDQFVQIFGAGEPAVADALIGNCRKPSGGVNPQTGAPTDGAFNLIEEPWLGRFQHAAAIISLQRAQVQTAVDAFAKSRLKIVQYAPDLLSERALGFMLDVANQFGDSGAQRLYASVHRPGMQQKEVLAAIAEKTVANVSDPLKAGVQARRDHFLQTSFLSDTQEA